MTLENNEINSMNEVINNVESSMRVVKTGEIVKGKIISVTDNEAIINIGYMSDAILPKNEVNNSSEVSLKDILNEGDEIYTYILDMNDGDGNVLVSKIAADRVKVWDELENYLKNDSTFEVTVNEVVKGGVVTYVNTVRAFIPASQLSISYVEDLNEYIGERLNVKVIELDKSKAKVVLSRKEVEKSELEAKKLSLLKNIKPGEKLEGTVSRITSFGAFVDLGGIDGLIHISELSWKRVNDPSEVVSVGDKVEVYVLEVNKDKNKISLSLKDISKDPWNDIENKYKVGHVVDGVVSKFLNFGAFVELEPGVEGLVHISEISEDRISKPSDILNIGNNVKVKILDVNKKEKKISLSIKEAVEKPKEDFKKYVDKNNSGVTLGDLFKDKLKNFKFD
ncbi:30S ribosomal protein S1 [Clostridium sp. DJ247]|uniref:30S ribosomal protein S1 n=1 Tax=Clostridium sp. DJ247 TaxID=2726188 RepID=UPI0016235A30|nr:30S ribosomal protein S1 [Clostridium sp. DJ247]MBC2581049.1 30S ribosomal protein S1 [Clostridium sp. DJ247]